MTESPERDRKDVTVRLASARQSVDLLLSQAKSGQVDYKYWIAQLSKLGVLLEDFSEEREANLHDSRLAALAAVSQMLGSSLDLNTVLNQVMDAIIKLTGAERGFLMLISDDSRLEVKVAQNLDREALEEDEFAISRSVINRVVKSGTAVVTTNASSDPRFSEQESVIAYKLRSIQCAPLRVRGKTIGVVYVDNRIKAGVFSDIDLDVLEAFSSQAAMAIDNARLFTLTDNALEQRVEELSMLQEIDRQLNETLDFGKTMSTALTWAMRVTAASNGAIALIDLDEGTTSIIAQHGEAPAGVAAMLSGEEVGNEVGSLTVPIQREGRVIGVIALDRDDGKAFDQQSREFALRLADHAAISIENARLYEEVNRANLAKSEFVSVMTHELRIPMTSIRGYADMMGMMGELSEQQTKFLEIIKNNVTRMSHQVSDLSDIARIESGRLLMELEDNVNLKACLEQVLNAVQAEIDERGHEVVVNIPEELPDVHADPQRVIQILTNLISNAYKYTPNGGAVTIAAGMDGDDAVWCEVSDTGVGMTAEDIAMLFTKFWRGDDQHVRQQPGTGLGLAIAKNLTEMQKGIMSVHSEKEVGTTFRFTLPVSG